MKFPVSLLGSNTYMGFLGAAAIPNFICELFPAGKTMIKKSLFSTAPILVFGT
ncbi:hypothetical protein S101189_02010 (plasmid) [Pediococcus acidilactici]|nr:hypothetical protein S100424_02048 [Pediococcus acidilactici]ARW29530.1 hypothetical protein S101189_02010 [Pediococcus acidilactici]OBR25222.1 hypothetical protein SRCM100320_02074 [Pediococcus acidilactici]